MPRDDTIHVAAGFDGLMELSFLVMAHSIARRLKPGRKVVFHVLHTQPLRHVATFLDRFSSDACAFRLYAVDNPLADMRMRNGVTAATYLRFLLPELLADVERVAWIDCDTVVLRDIAELYDTDLDGFALAAVPDHSIAGAHPLNGWLIGEEPNTWPVDVYFEQIVGLDDWRTYFNAGILVMDLRQFRDRGLIDTCRGFVFRTDDVRIFNDQDALNHVINGAFKPLDPRWNVQASRKPRDFEKAQGALAEVARLWQSDPWILHYTGPGKPWIGNMAGSSWDRAYWREAMVCPILPELIELYLDTCEQEEMANLLSPRELLALGKPKLDEDALRQCAAGLQEVPAASFDAVAGRLDAWSGGGALAIPARRFRHRDASREGEVFAFDLAGFVGHLVYGPYACYPAGNYEVVFDLAREDCDSGPGSRLVIEVAADLDCFKAQRTLEGGAELTERSRTLAFSLDGSELSVEFRIFVSGYAGGRLRFGGVRLSRHSLPQRDPWNLGHRLRDTMRRVGLGRFRARSPAS